MRECARDSAPLSLHTGTDQSQQQWFKPGADAYRQWADLQYSQSHPHSSHHCPGVAGKSVTLVPRDTVLKQPKQGANPVVHPKTTKQLDKQCQQSPSMEKS